MNNKILDGASINNNALKMDMAECIHYEHKNPVNKTHKRPRFGSVKISPKTVNSHKLHLESFKKGFPADLIECLIKDFFNFSEKKLKLKRNRKLSLVVGNSESLHMQDSVLPNPGRSSNCQELMLTKNISKSSNPQSESPKELENLDEQISLEDNHNEEGSTCSSISMLEHEDDKQVQVYWSRQTEPGSIHQCGWSQSSLEIKLKEQQKNEDFYMSIREGLEKNFEQNPEFFDKIQQVLDLKKAGDLDFGSLAFVFGIEIGGDEDCGGTDYAIFEEICRIFSL